MSPHVIAPLAYIARQSLWAVERFRTSGLRPTLHETLVEFACGYALTMVVALMFVALAVRMLHESGEALPEGSAALAAALVQLYSGSLGAWAVPVVSTAASCAMLGTFLTILDAYMRTLSRCALTTLDWTVDTQRKRSALSAVSLVYVAIASYILTISFRGGLRALVDLATTASFIIAPAVGAINLHLVTRSSFPMRARPARWLRVLAWAGLAFCVGFCVLYAWTLVDPQG